MKNQSLKIKVQNYFKKLSAISYQLSANKNGFTLIEIVMIIVIVSIAIPALLIVLGQETRQSVDAELQVSATNVAQALMEEIKTKRWDENSPIPPELLLSHWGLTERQQLTHIMMLMILTILHPVLQDALIQSQSII